MGACQEQSTTFKCPFCKGHATAGYEEDGRPMVCHSLPMCRRFEELEVGAYIAEVNRMRLS